MRLGVTVSTAWDYYKVCYVFITIIGCWSLRFGALAGDWRGIGGFRSVVEVAAGVAEGEFGVREQLVEIAGAGHSLEPRSLVW